MHRFSRALQVLPLHLSSAINLRGERTKRSARVGRAIFLIIPLTMLLASPVAGGKPAPSASISASPASITLGAVTTLSWSTARAQSVTLNGVPVGKQGLQTVSPSQTTTYYLAATSSTGSILVSATVYVSISTTPTPSTSMTVPNASLSASPMSILSGQSSTLSWTTSNATLVTLNGTSVPADGSLVEYPQATTTYTLTATNNAGSQSSTTTVTVTAGAPSNSSSTISTPNAIPAGDPRDPALWPFATNSVWNYPIGSNVVTSNAALGDGRTWAQEAASGGAFYVNGPAFVPSVYIGSTTDPLNTLCLNQSASSAMRALYGTNTFKRHFPTNIALASGEPELLVISPAHLTSIEQYWPVRGSACGNPSGTEWDIGQAYGNASANVDLKGPGVWQGSGASRDDMSMALSTGDEATPFNVTGVASGNSISAGGQLSASRSSSLGGLLRSGELANGINHALRLEVYVTMLNRTPPGTSNHWVWPAAMCDGGTCTNYGSAGPLYMGGLIMLPTSAITGHNFSSVQGRNIALALNQYGGYVVDTACASTCVVILIDRNAENDVPPDSVIGSDYQYILRHLTTVVNSFNPAGGGPPRGGYKLDGGDGTVTALIAPPFATQFGGGIGRTSYFIPFVPRSLWAWLTRGVLH